MLWFIILLKEALIQILILKCGAKVDLEQENAEQTALSCVAQKEGHNDKHWGHNWTSKINNILYIILYVWRGRFSFAVLLMHA